MSASKQPSATVSRTGRFGLVTISIRADSGASTHPVQARVIAQDCWLVMDPETPVLDSPQSAAESGFADALAADHKPGEVVLRRDSQPLRLWAIVHDLNRQPTSCKPWITTALLNTFRELARRRVASVSMPCFGYAQSLIPQRSSICWRLQFARRQSFTECTSTSIAQRASKRRCATHC